MTCLSMRFQAQESTSTWYHLSHPVETTNTTRDTRYAEMMESINRNLAGSSPQLIGKWIFRAMPGMRENRFERASQVGRDLGVFYRVPWLFYPMAEGQEDLVEPLYLGYGSPEIFLRINQSG